MTIETEDEMPITPDQAAALATAIGNARGLRPGQLPSGPQFAEGLNGLEECAGFLDRAGQANAPFPAVVFSPVPTVEAGEGGR